MALFDFIETIPADDGDGFWIVVEGRDGQHEVVDDRFDTKAEADVAGKSYRHDCLREETADRQEAAMQAGMLHGIDAYNDALSY